MNTFFNRNYEATISCYLFSNTDALTMSILAKIVALIDLLSLWPDGDDDNEEKLMTLKRAMTLFVCDEEKDGDYHIRIMNTMRFWLAIDHISSGLLFCQAAALVEHARVCHCCPKFIGIIENILSQFAWALVGMNLHIIFDILLRPKLFAFSNAGDSRTRFETSFFNYCL